jgi:hypothetical protein
LDMTKIHPECRTPSEQSVIADLKFRQEPDEEEDEEDDEGDGKNDDDDDRDDSGYSEKEIVSIESYARGLLNCADKPSQVCTGSRRQDGVDLYGSRHD